MNFARQVGSVALLLLLLSTENLASVASTAGNAFGGSLIAPTSAATLAESTGPLTKKIKTKTTTTIEETTFYYNGSVLVNSVTTVTTKVSTAESTVNEVSTPSAQTQNGSTGNTSNSATVIVNSGNNSLGQNGTNSAGGSTAQSQPQSSQPQTTTPNSQSAPTNTNPAPANTTPPPTNANSTANTGNSNNSSQNTGGNAITNNNNIISVPSTDPQSGLEKRIIGQAIFFLLNTYRQSKQLPILTWNEQAYSQAFQHTQYQVARKSISHDKFAQRAVGWKAINENVAMFMGYTVSDQRAAEQFMTMWTNSPSHNANMLSDAVTQGAVAVIYIASTQSYYATMENVSVW